VQILRSTVDRSRFLLLFVGVCVGFTISAADAGAQGAEVFQVTNLSGSGVGSLRNAINEANASTASTKTITFDVAANGTINLLTDLPDVEDGITINGSTAENLTVKGAGETTRIFRINSETMTVRDLGLEGKPLEIGSGASLSFDISADQQFDDVITDEGRLVKDGIATLTLRGDNEYTGGTLVSEGTLRGDTRSLKGGITNSALLVFDQSDDGEYDGAITGTGAVQKTGDGVVLFKGGNTYSGGTTISAGVLRGDATSLQGNIAVESGGRVVFDEVSDKTYAGNLTGSGDFTKRGVGTLTLTGTNTISGQSKLVIGALHGSFASIPKNLSSEAGTLVTFDHETNGTYSGSISGMADVTKIGTGTLTFSGSNTYDGVTTVSAGTLRAAPQNLPNETTSSIVNDAELILDTGGTSTYKGVISGTGNLTKSGSGTVGLTGDHTFTGTTSITGGRLDVDGSLATGVDVGASGVLGGASGVLGGNNGNNLGEIGGEVVVNGTVAPGTVSSDELIGTLSVDSVSFAPSAVFEVDVVDEPSGTADQLIVVGNADLGGATVQVNQGPGSYDTLVQVTILTADSISDNFATFEDDSAFLNITVEKIGTIVELKIQDNGETPSDYAETPNQETIAKALQAAETAGTDPDIDTVFESMNTLSVAQVPPALDSMTGETLTQFATRGQRDGGGGPFVSRFDAPWERSDIRGGDARSRADGRSGR